MEALKNWRPTMPRVDVPEFHRCCFCLPLRYGLLVWGYIKMVGLFLVAYQLFKDLILVGFGYFVLDLLILVVCIDFAFNGVFIVAGHLKHPKLYHIYYYYSIVLLSIYFLVSVSFIAWEWYGYSRYSALFVLRVTLELLTLFLPIFCVQGYVTLLVRTEFRKLANGSNFEFVNNATEPTCTMDMVTQNEPSAQDIH